jgi:hypothetical protein
MMGATLPSPEIPMLRLPQQTIKLAIDCETGELVSAKSLLLLEEAEFTALRRSAMEARIARKRGGSDVRFKCAICKQPVYLARYKGTYTNRWFVHDGKSENCPWYEKNRLTPEQTKALIYRGQQEGAAHKAMKQFLADWLKRDPLITEVNQEQTTFSEVMKGEWRRPDVKCEYRGLRLVFEIQLSYTFLSDVIARDEFYRREGIFIIWVFALFELNRAAVTDEAFFNHRNLFILDTEAVTQTRESGILAFSGYRQVPQLISGHVEDEWESKFTNLSDVTFPTDSYRPYFFDYDAERKAIECLFVQAGTSDKESEGTPIESLRVQASLFGSEPEENTIARKIDDYLNAAVRYYDSDYARGMKDILLVMANNLSKACEVASSSEVLRDDRFIHYVLPVLLSIKHGVSIGYSKSFSVYQVIEAGLRAGHSGRKHALTILYLLTYKRYKPAVSTKHYKWLSDYAHKVKASIDAGEDTYRRFTGYDKVVGLLFPEMPAVLATSFGV